MSNETKENNLTGQRDFRHLFCLRYSCPLEQFEEKIFQKCLFAHAIQIAPVIRWFDASVFQPDFDLIRYASTTTSLSELQRE